MNGLAGLAPFALIAVVFWLLLIRPQRRRQLDLMATQRGVAVGDEVLLGAGIVGRVSEADDDYLRLEVDVGVHLKVSRQSVVRVLQPEGEEPDGATPTMTASDPMTGTTDIPDDIPADSSDGSDSPDDSADGTTGGATAAAPDEPSDRSRDH